MDLTKLNNERLDDCGASIFTLSSVGDCNVNIRVPIGGGRPSIYDPYKKVVNIRGCIIRHPREIIRQVSENCRTQSVESAVKYSLQGKDIFTPDKMDELEILFHGKEISINGVKVIFKGGQVFEPLGDAFPNEFRLNVEIEECTKRIVYGCGGRGNCDYIRILLPVPDRIETGDFFSSSGVRIGKAPDLMAYYRQKTGVVQVQDVTDSLNLDCSVDSVIEITTTGSIPDYVYFDRPQPKNRIYPRVYADDAEICHGQPSAQKCAAPVLGAPVVADTTCTAPVLGVPVVIRDSCGVELMNGWQQNGEVSLVETDGQYTLNIYAAKSSLKPVPTDETDTVNYIVTDGGQPVCYWQDDQFVGRNVYDIVSVTVDGAEIQDTLYVFDSVDGSITFVDPCPRPVTSLVAVFRAGTSYTEPTINEVIAEISCPPSQSIPFNIDNYTVMTIRDNGEVNWNGKVPADESGATIVINNLTYQS